MRSEIAHSFLWILCNLFLLKHSTHLRNKDFFLQFIAEPMLWRRRREIEGMLSSSGREAWNKWGVDNAELAWRCRGVLAAVRRTFAYFVWVNDLRCGGFLTFFLFTPPRHNVGGNNSHKSAERKSLYLIKNDYVYWTLWFSRDSFALSSRKLEKLLWKCCCITSCSYWVLHCGVAMPLGYCVFTLFSQATHTKPLSKYLRWTDFLMFGGLNVVAFIENCQNVTLPI